MSEDAEACFVLPLREAAANFASLNARFAEADLGGSAMAILMRALTYPQAYE
jgi:hypothetical protein